MMHNFLKERYLLLGFLVGTFSALLFLTYLGLRTNFVVFIALTLFLFVLLMGILFYARKVLSVITVGAFLFISGYGFFVCEAKLWMVIFYAILLVATFLIQSYHRSCLRAIQSCLIRRRGVVEEKNNLKQQHEVKKESLKGLERRVDEIFKLFEVAKDFNECISFNQIGRIVTEKVFYDIPFKKGFLLTLEGRKKKSVYKMFSFTEMNWVEVFDLGPYDPVALTIFLQNNRRIVQVPQDLVGSFAFITGNIYDFPVWIFPLLVEDKMIAILILEGAREEDFSKFSIVAAQLALQVKKINLYNTVKELSITDGLTGVFLRRHFIERFNEELKRTIRHKCHLTVLMLDIDHFKTYNDTFGHLVGDVTLREVSRIIKENVRKVDLISRYGGEEFAIVLPETTKMGGFEAAERIRQAISREKFRVYDEETRVTVSIGFSTFPDDLVEKTEEFRVDLALELLQKADQALYRAKEQGRDRVVEYRVH